MSTHMPANYYCIQNCSFMPLGCPIFLNLASILTGLGNYLSRCDQPMLNIQYLGKIYPKDPEANLGRKQFPDQEKAQSQT